MEALFIKKSEVPAYLQASGFLKCWDNEVDEAVSVPSDAFKPDATVHSVEDLKHLLETLRHWMVYALPYTAIDFVLEACSDIGDILGEFKDQMPDLNCVLKWLSYSNFSSSVDSILELTVRHDRSNCLKYLLQHRLKLTPIRPDCRRTFGLCAIAASSGSINCLTYLHEAGCRGDYSTVENSAANGHAECLLYVMKHGCDGPKRAAATAVKAGHLHILEILPLPMDVNELISLAAAHGKLDILEYLHTVHGQLVVPAGSAVYHAASNGRLACLKYLHERGYPWSASVALVAANNGHVECLKYALENGCPRGSFLCMYTKSTEVRAYLVSIGEDVPDLDDLY